jgi:hypothetical protein
LAKDSFTRNGVTYEVDLRVPYPRPHYNLMFANVITDTQTGRKHTYAYDRGHAYTSALWFEQGGSRARITCAAPVNTTVAVTYVTDEPHSVATTQPAAEGDLATVSAAGSFDPRGGELAYAWDLDKDGVYDDGHQVEARFRAPVVGDYTLGLQVTDSLGRTSRTTFDVRAANAAPVVQLGGDLEIGADGVFEQDGSFTDPGADSWTAELSYGDGAPAGPLALNGKSLTLSHTYGQAGQYTVTVRVSDLAGASIGQAKVLVRVLAPSGASSPPAELAAGVRWPT